MALSQEEKVALGQLLGQIREIKIATFDRIWTSRDLDPKFSGHKSLEDRAWRCIQDAQKDIDKLNAAYLKRFPDK